MNPTDNAVNIFNRLASLYQDKYMNVDRYARSLGIFCNALSKDDASILELACGPGNITKYLLGLRLRLKILGTDLAPAMLELAAINNPSAEFMLMDCRDPELTGKTYDAVVAGFCLPYLSKQESIGLIQNAYGALNTGGLLYLSTMEDDYEKSGLKSASTGDTLFIYYHAAGYLLEALRNNRFRLLHQERVQYTGPDQTPVCDLILIARK